ncbi:MAG: sigma-70 family RNA polymerase sigma factor [Dermatophilaceae bacterium]
MPSAQPAQLEAVFRAEHGRVVAALVGRFRDLDLAEDAVGDALVAAVEHWQAHGIPPNPGGWLTTTATRRAIDRIRRESTRPTREASSQLLGGADPPPPTGAVVDDQLRLIFTCCHPALAPEARVALTLRLLGGLTVAEIARAFLVAESTMAQRLTRAKRKIAAAEIPFRVPDAAELPGRVGDVLTTLYLIFNEGYLASSGQSPIRTDLCAEAIRLSRLVSRLLPDEPEADGLLALLLLSDARRGARFADGVLVPLREQDRSRWDAGLIGEGHALVRRCLARGRPGQYQVLAAINAVHTDAAAFADTDWHQIVRLYDQLTVIAPTPVVALNRAIAVAELDGADVGLAQVERLDLATYHAWHATRAELLRRLQRTDEAVTAYDAAIAATENRAEQAYLRRRRDELAAPPDHPAERSDDAAKPSS